MSIGYVTPDTKELSNTGNVVLKDEILSLKKFVKEVRQKGVNIIIALGHSGYEKDLEVAKRVSNLKEEKYSMDWQRFLLEPLGRLEIKLLFSLTFQG